MNRSILGSRPAVTVVGGLALVAVVALTVVVLGSFSANGPGPAGAATTSSTTSTVSTTATGKATAVPDNLVANLDVHTTGDTAAAVLDDNNSRTHALLAKLAADGVDSKDVQTTALNLQTTWDDHGNVTGYQADDDLTVTFRTLKTAGSELDQLVASAGNAARIEGVSFGFNDEDSLADTARADAVARAKAQATTMAKAAGAKLGAVRSIAEVSTPTYPNIESAAAGAPNADSASVPLAAGSQDITVQVRVVFVLG